MSSTSVRSPGWRKGLEGLIHVSELAEGSFMHPRNVIREGDHVRARVIAGRWLEAADCADAAP